MSLPNFSALSLRDVEPTDMPSSSLSNLREDADTFHYRFMTPHIDFSALHQTDRFYHQTFCPGISNYCEAFACNTKFATALAAPTAKVFEWLYNDFEQHDFIGTKYTRRPNETAYAFFRRACKDATTTRDAALAKLKEIKEKYDQDARDHHGTNLRKYVNRWRREAMFSLQDCTSDRAFIAKTFADQNDEYVMVDEYAPLNILDLMDTRFKRDPAFLAEVWASRKHKSRTRLTTPNCLFNHLNHLVACGVWRPTVVEVAVRLVQDDPKRLHVAFNLWDSSTFLNSYRMSAACMMATEGVRRDPSLLDSFEIEVLGSPGYQIEETTRDMQWRRIVDAAQSKAVEMVKRNAAAITTIGTKLLTGEHEVAQRLFKANKGAFKVLVESLPDEKDPTTWHPLVLAYLAEHPKGVEDLPEPDKRNGDLVMSIMVLLPDTVEHAEKYLKQYYDAGSWDQMKPSDLTDDEDDMD